MTISNILLDRQKEKSKEKESERRLLGHKQAFNDLHVYQLNMSKTFGQNTG